MESWASKRTMGTCNYVLAGSTLQNLRMPIMAILRREAERVDFLFSIFNFILFSKLRRRNGVTGTMQTMP